MENQKLKSSSFVYQTQVTEDKDSLFDHIQDSASRRWINNCNGFAQDDTKAL